MNLVQQQLWVRRCPLLKRAVADQLEVTDLVESDAESEAETKADGAAARADRHERNAHTPGRTQVSKDDRWQPRRCRASRLAKCCEPLVQVTP